jgi:hypothetical protein
MGHQLPAECRIGRRSLDPETLEDGGERVAQRSSESKDYRHELP